LDEEDAEDMGLIDEYNQKIEKLSHQLQHKEITVRELNVEFDALTKSSQADAKLLLKKSEEIERLKRTLA
jgi:hypothetical protein